MREMGRVITVLCVGSMLVSFSACGSGGESREDADMFDTYVSNTVIATGNNTVIEEADSVTYRAWFPVEAAGEFDYCFYFSNTVDSTWGDGELAYAGMSGGAYTIESAYILDGGEEFDANYTVDIVAQVTFDGETSKSVDPNETFWSDSVTFDVPEGHYLIWEWTVSGENIPAMCMSNLTYSYADKGDDKGFLYTNEIPLPQMIGVDREVETRIVTLGDSITQGCGTTDYAYQFWAAKLLEDLGSESYSLWNLGNGYARATDCALDEDWLSRAIAGADLITVAFATNDIVSGAYGEGGSSSAEEIQEAMEVILGRCKDAKVETIMMNAPPFDLIESMEEIRLEYNDMAEDLADDYKATFFDWASLLADPNDVGATVNGQHPDDTGCTIIADALVDVVRDLCE